jgi:hypothetical protein
MGILARSPGALREEEDKMRFVVGYALTVAFSAGVTIAVIHILQPEVTAAEAALRFLRDNWPHQ